MRKKKTNKSQEAPPIVHRDAHDKTNATLARMIYKGEIDRDNWRYIVRKMGYKTRPVEILLEAYYGIN